MPEVTLNIEVTAEELAADAKVVAEINENDDENEVEIEMSNRCTWCPIAAKGNKALTEMGHPELSLVIHSEGAELVGPPPEYESWLCDLPEGIPGKIFAIDAGEQAEAFSLSLTFNIPEPANV